MEIPKKIIAEIHKAIRDEGPNPQKHRRVMDDLKIYRPVMYKALFLLIEFLEKDLPCNSKIEEGLN